MDSTEKPTVTTTSDPVSSQQNSEASHAKPVDSAGDLGATSNAPDSESAPTVKPCTLPSQSHLSTAQKVFAGLPNAGLMCNNLRANPFSVTENPSSSFGILAKPRFSLKPSSFAANADSTPAAASSDQSASGNLNPFLRPAKLSYDNEHDDANHNSGDAKESTKETSSSSPSQEPSSSDNVKESNHGSSASDTNNTAAVSSSSDGNMSTSASSQPSTLVPSTEGFTFGSNLASRASQSSFVFGEALDSRVTNVTKENGTNGHSETDEKPKTMTLEEAADEYKKQQEIGPILPEVETITGEEGESNVLQISCKLFLFNDKENSWAEKGRGLLRLNDDADGSHSRIVMRTAGIHRVILNTSIWHSMICERANQKSIRITGTEADQVHVYLLTGSPADIDHLYNAVTYRTQRLKQNLSTQNASSSGESESAKRKTEGNDEVSPKKLRQEEASGGKVAE